MITITIKTNNAAFQPHQAPEVARILRELALHLDDAERVTERLLRDYNGNTVGKVRVTR